jgi:hypothetical protein
MIRFVLKFTLQQKLEAVKMRCFPAQLMATAFNRNRRSALLLPRKQSSFLILNWKSLDIIIASGCPDAQLPSGLTDEGNGFYCSPLAFRSMKHRASLLYRL